MTILPQKCTTNTLSIDRHMQVQNQLNAFIVLAAFLWIILAAVTLIMQQHSAQQAIEPLW